MRISFFDIKLTEWTVKVFLKSFYKQKNLLIQFSSMDRLKLFWSMIDFPYILLSLKVYQFLYSFPFKKIIGFTNVNMWVYVRLSSFISKSCITSHFISCFIRKEEICNFIVTSSLKRIQLGANFRKSYATINFNFYGQYENNLFITFMNFSNIKHFVL